MIEILPETLNCIKCAQLLHVFLPLAWVFSPGCRLVLPQNPCFKIEEQRQNKNVRKSACKVSGQVFLRLVRRFLYGVLVIIGSRWLMRLSTMLPLAASKILKSTPPTLPAMEPVHHDQCNLHSLILTMLEGTCLFGHGQIRFTTHPMERLRGTFCADKIIERTDVQTSSSRTNQSKRSMMDGWTDD